MSCLKQKDYRKVKVGFITFQEQQAQIHEIKLAQEIGQRQTEQKLKQGYRYKRNGKTIYLRK